MTSVLTTLQCQPELRYLFHHAKINTLPPVPFLPSLVLQYSFLDFILSRSFLDLRSLARFLNPPFLARFRMRSSLARSLTVCPLARFFCRLLWLQQQFLRCTQSLARFFIVCSLARRLNSSFVFSLARWVSLGHAFNRFFRLGMLSLVFFYWVCSRSFLLIGYAVGRLLLLRLLSLVSFNWV